MGANQRTTLTVRAADGREVEVLRPGAANALGVESFHCIGMSGAGPQPIATAALVPERVISAAASASPAPLGADGLDGTAGMCAENIAENAASPPRERELERHLERGSYGETPDRLLGLATPRP